MIIVDANILLYAYNADAPQQPTAAQWITATLASGETLALPWITVWAFLRISTNGRIYANPLTPDQAFGIINNLLEQPGIALLLPGPRHLELLRRLVNEYEAVGPLMSDAVLAALALESGASVASTDQDFRRFPAVKWINPVKSGTAVPERRS